MTPAPKRRWFRFSLRTLFVVVTICACWLGYEFNWIRQRRAFLDDQQRHWIVDGPRRFVPFYGSARAPFPLWLFGEDGVRTLHVVVVDGSTAPPNLAHQDRYPETRQAMRLFPEAMLIPLILPPDQASPSESIRQLHQRQQGRRRTPAPQS